MTATPSDAGEEAREAPDAISHYLLTIDRTTAALRKEVEEWKAKVTRLEIPPQAVRDCTLDELIDGLGEDHLVSKQIAGLRCIAANKYGQDANALSALGSIEARQQLGQAEDNLTTALRERDEARAILQRHHNLAEDIRIVIDKYAMSKGTNLSQLEKADKMLLEIACGSEVTPSDYAGLTTVKADELAGLRKDSERLGHIIRNRQIITTNIIGQPLILTKYQWGFVSIEPDFYVAIDSAMAARAGEGG